jgi:ribonuclease Z
VSIERRIGQPTTTTVSAGGYTFVGASTSAYTTFIYSPDLKVVFDMGSVVEEMLPIDHVLITHAHQDHLLGLTRYVALRRLQRMAPPTIFMPEGIVNRVRDLIALWQDLESEGTRQPPPVELVGVTGGEEAFLRGSLLVQTFPVSHSLTSVGYTLIDRKMKLKQEFFSKTGPELAELKRLGTSITQPLDQHLVTFIGDTLPETLDVRGDLAASKVIIVEATFLEPDHLELAEARGHLHIQHLVQRIPQLGDAEIVLTHFSRRYRRKDIERLVREQWPKTDLDRLHLLV